MYDQKRMERVAFWTGVFILLQNDQVRFVLSWCFVGLFGLAVGAELLSGHWYDALACLVGMVLAFPYSSVFRLPHVPWLIRAMVVCGALYFMIDHAPTGDGMYQAAHPQASDQTDSN